jgi:sterol desaturase/sphingolipid hydroxylase (fatty acid hydroxylase superfamily)
LERQISSAIPTGREFIVAVGYGALAFVLLALLFIPLERAFAGRHQSYLRPAMTLDLLYCGLQYLVMSFVLLAFNDYVSSVAGTLLPIRWLAAVAAVPWTLQVLVGIVLGDVLLYWGHRACHRVPFLWRVHAIHHSAEQLDWVAAHREHPLDGLFSQLCLTFPAAMLGIPIAAVGPIFMMRGLVATFVHSNVRMPLGILGVMLGDPVLHRWHHARVSRCQHNFANVAPYLDVLFGTHFRPTDENYALGLVQKLPASFIGQLAAPFRRNT